MSDTERLFPVYSHVAIRQTFDEFTSRCEITLREVFGKSSSEGVDFKGWLYNVADTAADMLVMLHREPLYVAAEYLGIEKNDLTGTNDEAVYTALAEQRGWNRLKVT